MQARTSSSRTTAKSRTTTKRTATSTAKKDATKAPKSDSKQTGSQTGTGYMSDQERITDLMLSEKKMQENYCTFASECVSPKLRDEFLKIQKASHLTQYELFTQAQTRGWYKPKAAQATAIKQAYTKFSGMTQ